MNEIECEEDFNADELSEFEKEYLRPCFSAIVFLLRNKDSSNSLANDEILKSLCSDIEKFDHEPNSEIAYRKFFLEVTQDLESKNFDVNNVKDCLTIPDDWVDGHSVELISTTISIALLLCRNQPSNALRNEASILINTLADKLGADKVKEKFLKENMQRKASVLINIVTLECSFGWGMHLLKSTNSDQEFIVQVNRMEKMLKEFLKISKVTNDSILIDDNSGQKTTGSKWIV